MIQWQYKAEKKPLGTTTYQEDVLFGKAKTMTSTYTCDITDPLAVEWLNKLGAEGWEMVKEGYRACLFKRQVPGVPYRSPDLTGRVGYEGTNP